MWTFVNVKKKKTLISPFPDLLASSAVIVPYCLCRALLPFIHLPPLSLESFYSAHNDPGILGEGNLI